MNAIKLLHISVLITLFACSQNHQAGTRVGTDTVLQAQTVNASGIPVSAHFFVREATLSTYPWDSIPTAFASKVGTQMEIVVDTNKTLFMEAYNQDSSLGAWIVAKPDTQNILRMDSTRSLTVTFTQTQGVGISNEVWMGFPGTGAFLNSSAGALQTNITFHHIPKGGQSFSIFIRNPQNPLRFDFQGIRAMEQTLYLSQYELTQAKNLTQCHFEGDSLGQIVRNANQAPVCIP